MISTIAAPRAPATYCHEPSSGAGPTSPHESISAVGDLNPPTRLIKAGDGEVRAPRIAQPTPQPALFDRQGAMTTATDAARTTIDPAIRADGESAGCHKCGRPLDSAAPSPDFCSEDCQAGWLAEHAAPTPVDQGATRPAPA